MRRTAAVLVTTAALIGGLALAAPAATTVATRPLVDIATIDGTPVVTIPCAGTALDSQNSVYMSVVQNLDPSASTSVAWAPATTTNPGEAWGVSVPFYDALSASDLAVFKVDVFNGPTGVAAIQANSFSNASGAQRTWIGKAAISAGTPGQWATVDLSGETYTWTEYNPETNAVIASAGASTLAAFAAAHQDTSTVSTDYSPLAAFGCSGESFAVQHLQWGPAGPTAAYTQDLGTITNDVAIALSSKFIAAGTAATVTGSSQYGGAPNAVLSYKPANASTYSTATRAAYSTVIDKLICESSAGTCRNPFTSAVQHPMYNTVYRWNYPASYGVNAAASTFVMVHVQTKLVPTWPSSTQSVGRAFAMNGTTVPLKPGSKITLWGKNNGMVVNFGAETISSNGKWYGSVKFYQPGTWTFWYTIGNDKLNAGSKTALKTVYIH